MSVCRSCQRTIRWAIVKASGKRMPLDPEPAPNGNIEIVGSRPSEFGPADLVVVHPRGVLGLPGMVEKKRYLSHFATCPNAQSHRRRPAA